MPQLPFKHVYYVFNRCNHFLNFDLNSGNILVDLYKFLTYSQWPYFRVVFHQNENIAKF